MGATWRATTPVPELLVLLVTSGPTAFGEVSFDTPRKGKSLCFCLAFAAPNGGRGGDFGVISVGGDSKAVADTMVMFSSFTASMSKTVSAPAAGCMLSRSEGGEVFEPSKGPSQISLSTDCCCERCATKGGRRGGPAFFDGGPGAATAVFFSAPTAPGASKPKRSGDFRFLGRPRTFATPDETGGSSAGNTRTVVVAGAGAFLFTTHQSSSLSIARVNRGDV